MAFSGSKAKWFHYSSSGDFSKVLSIVLLLGVKVSTFGSEGTGVGISMIGRVFNYIYIGYLIV